MGNLLFFKPSILIVDCFEKEGIIQTDFLI
jgi:hypothetical protein